MYVLGSADSVKSVNLITHIVSVTPVWITEISSSSLIWRTCKLSCYIEVYRILVTCSRTPTLPTYPSRNFCEPASCGIISYGIISHGKSFCERPPMASHPEESPTME